MHFSAFLKIQWENDSGFFFLSRDQSVTSIYTELSSLVLAYLNNVMYLAACRNCLCNITSYPAWAEGSGAKPAAGTPVHDACALMINVGSWQYFYFLGFPIPNYNPIIITIIRL